MNKRVKTLLQRHGNDFFSRIGKKGFRVTTDRYFGGDSQAHIRWLVSAGKWAIDKELSYAKPGVYRNPGPHPSELDYQAEWLEDIERAISPNFPPFRTCEGEST